MAKSKKQEKLLTKEEVSHVKVVDPGDNIKSVMGSSLSYAHTLATKDAKVVDVVAPTSKAGNVDALPTAKK